MPYSYTYKTTIQKPTEQRIEERTKGTEETY